jgi:hypothetical protein
MCYSLAPPTFASTMATAALHPLSRIHVMDQSLLPTPYAWISQLS